MDLPISWLAWRNRRHVLDPANRSASCRGGSRARPRFQRETTYVNSRCRRTRRNAWKAGRARNGS